MAFISSSNTSSGKGEVPTASVPTASSQVSTVSTEVAAASLSHDTICAYIATQSSGSQIKYEDITQIDEDDIEEMDIKWNLALLSMRADRWNASIDFAKECRAPRSQDRGKRESYRKDPKVEEPAPKALMAIDGIGWDWSYMANEDENHALVADDHIAFLYGTIDEEVYVMQPPGFEDLEFPDKVYRVEKAMYRLHQAPKAWYGTLSKYLLANGFQRVLQKNDGIFILQDKYVGDILKKFGYTDVRTTKTPMDKENP
ncbi:ribonuclease H-like domain-containing protein [Tanacetum coccineum]